MTALSRKTGYRIAAVAMGLIVGFAGVEIVLRVLMKRPPGAQAVELKLPAPNLFLELPDAPLSRSPTHVYIAFIGDSFTFGTGVDADKNLVRQTNDILRQRHPGEYTAINLGTTGADLICEWVVYNRFRDIYRPNIVVHVISPNDMDVDYFEGLRKIEATLAYRSVFAQHSYFVALAEGYMRREETLEEYFEYLSGGRTTDQLNRAWRIIDREIAAIKGLVEEGGAIYVMTRFPEFLLDLDRYPLEHVHRRTAELADRLNVPYLDLLDVFRKQPRQQFSISRLDDHPNEKAHRIAAEAITDFLEKKVFPKMPATATSLPSLRRTPQQITALEGEHLREIIRLDPSCRSARLCLDGLLDERRVSRVRP